MPTGTTTKASVKPKMFHNLRETARTVYMVTSLKHNLFISESKFVDANYTTVLTLEEVLIYDGNEVKLRTPGQEILTGWR